METFAVRDLYTRKLGEYAAFIRFFQSREGLRRVFETGLPLRPGLTILDAGCGFGTATFALLDVLEDRDMPQARVDAFDLTPAMLSRFRVDLERRRMDRVRLVETDILSPNALPPSWNGYDIVLCASMFEYLPKPTLPDVLERLRARMVSGGHMLVMITRKSPETKLLIEWAWGANRYTRSELAAAFEAAGFCETRFLRFPIRYAWLNRANWIVTASTRSD